MHSSPSLTTMVLALPARSTPQASHLNCTTHSLLQDVAKQPRRHPIPVASIREHALRLSRDHDRFAPLTMPLPRFLFIAFCSIFLCFFIFHNRSSRTHFNMNQPLESLVVGISLTASYGTVSIRNVDGSFRDVKRIDGDQNYRDMMLRLSLRSEEHPAYVFYSKTYQRL